MANYATSANVLTLHTALSAYIDEITADDATTQTLLKAQATLALNRWADAQNAINSLNAGTLEQYSNAMGLSVQKKRLDQAVAASDAAWADFVTTCARGDVTIPSLDECVAYWDLSGEMA